jgi:hypothetical protein
MGREGACLNRKEDWGLIFTFDITDACGCEKRYLKVEGRDETTSV